LNAPVEILSAFAINANRSCKQLHASQKGRALALFFTSFLSFT